MDGRDRHNSQPVRMLPKDVLGREESEAAEAKEEVESAERAARLNTETAHTLTFKAIDRHLTEHIKLTREMNIVLKTLSSKTGNTEATLAIKAIGAEVSHIRAVSHVNEATLFAVHEVRDELRGLNGRADETNRLLDVLTRILSNGHGTTER